MALALLGAMGCAAQPRSSRLTIDDFQEMAAAMAESLRRSDALAERGPESEPWIVSMTKLVNLSSDVMTESEQWAILHDLRSSLPIQVLRQQKNVRFILPPEADRALRDELGDEFVDPLPARQPPTHTLTATIRSLTRAQAEGRTDLYHLEFELMNLRAGEPAWIDRFELKRRALGHIWD